MSIVPYIPGIQTHISALPKLTPNSAAGNIKTIINIIKVFIERDCKYPDYIKDAWLNQLAWLQSLCILMEKRIGFYGAAGVGKSSLIQALLEGPPFLPAESRRARTLYICEIRNNPDDQNYKTYIKQTLLMMLSDKQRNRKLKSKNNQNREQIISKLKGVYDPKDIKNWTVEKFCRDSRLKEHLEENCYKITVITSITSDLCKELKEYLMSPKTKNTMVLWPLIKRIEIRQPFDIFHGISLVDLPGFGDWDAARDKIAQDNLSSCDSIWVVAEATRASDSSTFKKTLSDNMQRQLLMDGKMSELVHIRSKSDVIEVRDDDFENLQLIEEYEKINARIEELEDNDDKDSLFEVVYLQQGKRALACIKRNELIERIPQENILEEIRQKLTNGQDSQSAFIQRRYNNISTISATSYIKLLKNKQDLTISFSKPEQTELLQLQKLRTEGYQVKINICLRDLHEKLRKTTSRLSAELKAIISDRLKKEVWRATQVGARDCRSNLINYVRKNGIRWNTYKAICRRDGEYNHLNFNQALLDPFLNVITDDWESAFISDVEIIIKSYLKILKTIFCDFLHSLEDIYEVAIISNEFAIPILQNFSSEITRKALYLLNTMKQKIQTIQHNCRRDLLLIIREKMTPGYEKASNCSGTGCYDMMKHYVDSQASSVSNEMFSEIYDHVVSDLDGVIVEVDEACSVLADTSDELRLLKVLHMILKRGRLKIGKQSGNNQLFQKIDQIR